MSPDNFNSLKVSRCFTGATSNGVVFEGTRFAERVGLF